MMHIANLQAYPFYACSAVCLGGFGEGAFYGSEYIDRNWSTPIPAEKTTYPSSYNTLEEFKKECANVAKTYDNDFIDYTFKDLYVNRCLAKMALVVAFTTDCQPIANKYLDELGFVSSPFIEKLKHRHSKLRVSWMPARDFMAAIGYVPSHKNIGKDDV